MERTTVTGAGVSVSGMLGDGNRGVSEMDSSFNPGSNDVGSVSPEAPPIVVLVTVVGRSCMA